MHTKSLHIWIIYNLPNIPLIFMLIGSLLFFDKIKILF